MGPARAGDLYRVDCAFSQIQNPPCYSERDLVVKKENNLNDVLSFRPLLSVQLILNVKYAATMGIMFIWIVLGILNIAFTMKRYYCFVLSQNYWSMSSG